MELGQKNCLMHSATTACCRVVTVTCLLYKEAGADKSQGKDASSPTACAINSFIDDSRREHRMQCGAYQWQCAMHIGQLADQGML